MLFSIFRCTDPINFSSTHKYRWVWDDNGREQKYGSATRLIAIYIKCHAQIQSANGSNALPAQSNPIIYYELDFCSVLHIDKISQCFSVSIRVAICFVVCRLSHVGMNVCAHSSSAAILFDTLHSLVAIASRAKLSSLFRGCSKPHEKWYVEKFRCADPMLSKSRTELNERH